MKQFIDMPLVRRGLKWACFLCLWIFLPMPGHATLVTKQWNAVTTNTDGSPCTDLAGYRIFIATNSILTLTPAEARANPAITKLDVSSSAVSTSVNLAWGATYYFRETAFNTSDNDSDFTPQVSAYLAAGVDTSSPAAPGALYASGVSSSAFTLGWTASTDDVAVTGYRLDISLDPGFSGFVAGYNDLNLGGVTSKVLTGLAVATRYYARLRAYDAAGNTSANSASLSTTTLAAPINTSPPAAPANFRITSLIDPAFTPGRTAVPPRRRGV